MARDINIEEYVEPEDVQNPNMSEKSKKLMAKIEKLSQKIEEEKSPLKRHVMSFQVKMILAKIQREINIQDIRDNYNDIRDSISARKERREDISLNEIASINNEIRALKREISRNEEYDASSPYFLYPEKYVKQSGGVSRITKKLKESKNPDAQETAAKIEEIAQKRQRLDQLYDDLENEQELLEDNNIDYKHDIKSINREEKALVLKQKFNIFSRIGNFFKNMTEEIKAYREEKKEIKELKYEQDEQLDKLDEIYERKMQELKEQYEKRKEEIKEIHKEERAEKQGELGKDKAESFRQKMVDMAKGEDEDTPTISEKDEEKSTDEQAISEEGEYRKQLIDKGVITPTDNGER